MRTNYYSTNGHLPPLDHPRGQVFLHGQYPSSASRVDRRTIYQALKRALYRVMTCHPFTIEAFVLLPDHLHCLWTLPLLDADYPRRWNLIKRYVSQDTRHLLAASSTASRQKRRELGLWQRRFWEHQIRDEHDFERHVDYIHWNPVKHGYVGRARDWPYSSFRRFVARGVYSPDWATTTQPDVGETGYGEAI